MSLVGINYQNTSCAVIFPRFKADQIVNYFGCPVLPKKCTCGESLIKVAAKLYKIKSNTCLESWYLVQPLHNSCGTQSPKFPIAKHSRAPILIHSSKDLKCLMDHQRGQLGGNELCQAQSHIYKHACSYVNSMCLNTAVQLGIPDAIQNHKQPITLPELVSSLHVPPEKSNSLRRLLRLLVHLGFFATAKVNTKEGDLEGYVLTPSSRLLVKSEITNFSPFVRATVDPVKVTAWQSLGDWFRRSEKTAFETAHGVEMWEFCNQNPKFSRTFSEAMASDSTMMNHVVGECKAVFQGLNSLVDAGGGTGTTARIISGAFPRIKCTVLDLPHVVANLPESGNLSYVGGDMFESIPSADAVLLKWILHDWSDEDCVKILKRCKEAIPSKDNGGKLIIIDAVMDGAGDDDDAAGAKLILDVTMMVMVGGRERSEREWEQIFLQAGFSHYKMTPTFGRMSLIEVYPS